MLYSTLNAYTTSVQYTINETGSICAQVRESGANRCGGNSASGGQVHQPLPPLPRASHCGSLRQVPFPYPVPQLHDDLCTKRQVPGWLCVCSLVCPLLPCSLGGNCMTSMIATCSVDKRNIDVRNSCSLLSLYPPPCGGLQETISTCRFSQRVAMIKNEVTVNEELDPKLVS